MDWILAILIWMIMICAIAMQFLGVGVCLFFVGAAVILSGGWGVYK